MAQLSQLLQVRVRDYIDRNPMNGEANILELCKRDDDIPFTEMIGERPYSRENLGIEDNMLEIFINACASTRPGPTWKTVVLMKFAWAANRLLYEENWSGNNSAFIAWAEKQYREILNKLADMVQAGNIHIPNEPTQEFADIFSARSAYDVGRRDHEKKVRW